MALDESGRNPRYIDADVEEEEEEEEEEKGEEDFCRKRRGP